jgi:hypothetical protein
VRAIFADAKAQSALAKMQTEYPDLYAEAMLLMPGPDDEPDDGTNDAEPHPGKAIADAIIAEINAPETNAEMDVTSAGTRSRPLARRLRSRRSERPLRR